MLLSVIIVNYNVKYFLEQALLSVRQASKALPIEVFVVDNNSSDDSVAMVREKFPEVHLIANSDNPGFSKANNQAIRLATGKYMLLLNPDTIVEEDTFEKCLQFMDSHPEVGGLGVRMIDGAGIFLPESKRGFPSPFVAFCKTFGLSALFPKSPIFNRYHLGFLDPLLTHEVDVLAGAFMLMPKAVLDKIGLLDEQFFMYGEDIDLSYRIQLGGYKNCYFADTTIIHYKGESTKKGSLNYVKVFYNAMILFARKHFKGQQAWLFILMLQFAIYFRASLTLLGNLFKTFALPMLDAALIGFGLLFLKDFWANQYFNNPNYYDVTATFVYFNIPLYIIIWLSAVYFCGGYDSRRNIAQVTRGLLLGTVILAAVYGFLDMSVRSSRVLLLLGAVWSIISLLTLRVLLHFIKFKNFNISEYRQKNSIIIGDEEEGERVLQLLRQAQAPINHIGLVAPSKVDNRRVFLGSLGELGDLVSIYKIEEIIFCSKNVAAQDIMRWMTQLGTLIEYKIVPQESFSIIGSSSKNTTGELYTIDIQFEIATAFNRRNKRLFDVLLAFSLLVLSPLLLCFVIHKVGFFYNIFNVLKGSKTWVAYHHLDNKNITLPRIKQGILTPVDGLKLSINNTDTIQRLNFLYAKDYQMGHDFGIVLKAWRYLGRS